MTPLERDFIRVLGGKGSGNFGHAGRKGEIGGSSDSGTTTVYHGTSLQSAQSIRKEGLKAGKSGQNFTQSQSEHVYLTTDLAEVKEWAWNITGGRDMYDEKIHRYADLAVLKVEIPKGHAGLTEDKNFPGGKALQFRGDIPSTWIKEISTAIHDDNTLDVKSWRTLSQVYYVPILLRKSA